MTELELIGFEDIIMYSYFQYNDGYPKTVLIVCILIIKRWLFPVTI